MAWTQLRNHPVQQRLWRSAKRFRLVQAGRGSGKTELAKRFIVRNLPIIKPWTDPRYFYALPTYNQAKRVAWNSIVDLIPKEWIADKKESTMYIKTVFGSELYIVGCDKPARIEGNQWDGCVIDESSDQKPGLFERSVRPALSHRKGWAWRIGVTKRFGIGAHVFNDAFDQALAGELPDAEAFTWSSEDILPEDEILAAKRSLSVEDYEEQYRASRMKVAGLIFYAFDEILNVDAEVTYMRDAPIIVGSDFNVDPMSWCLCHTGRNGLICFDEIRLRNTNTQETLNELYKRYGAHKAGFYFMGDASSRARKTSASSTDYVQIKQDTRFKDAKVYYLKSNPPIADRFASCNALFCNAANERRFLVHPRCKSLIKDLTSIAYKPGTREPQLGDGLGHMSDALGYIIYKLFPLKFNRSSSTTSVVMRA